MPTFVSLPVFWWSPWTVATVSLDRWQHNSYTKMAENDVRLKNEQRLTSWLLKVKSRLVFRYVTVCGGKTVERDSCSTMRTTDWRRRKWASRHRGAGELALHWCLNIRRVDELIRGDRRTTVMLHPIHRYWQRNENTPRPWTFQHLCSLVATHADRCTQRGTDTNRHLSFTAIRCGTWNIPVANRHAGWGGETLVYHSEAESTRQ